MNIKCIAELAGRQIARPGLSARSISKQCLIRNTQNSCITAKHARVTRLNLHSAFSTSQSLAKGKNKAGKAAKEEKQASSSKSGNEASSDDPFDFTALEADIANALEKLKNDLSKLRAGGRFNPEVVESLRVQPDKSADQTVKLSDLAQVIPKGRTVQILVGEKDVSEKKESQHRTIGLINTTARKTSLLSNSILLPISHPSA